ncbi:hypothetical protein ACWGRF_00030 [Streptomyces zhihengii]
MRLRPAARLLLAAAVTVLTGCRGSSGTHDKPAATKTVTATPTLSAAEARAACVDAWADTIAARPDDFDPESGNDPDPVACEGLPEDEWLDMYLEGLQKSDEANADEMRDCLDDPACTRLPVDGS